MKWSRREFVASAAGAGVLSIFDSGCVRGRPQPRVLTSLAPIPAPFETALPIIPVLKPTRADASADYYEIAPRAGVAQILPGLKTTVWGYNGIFPGPTVVAQSGRRAVLHLRNELPVPVVNHLHGGHTPVESDGYPTDFVLPEGFLRPHMHDVAANVHKGERDYVYPNDQRAATLWYHDHRMDYTAPQVWRGLAGFYILRDDEEQRLPLPGGDKDIALLICDRSFNQDGSFRYPSIDPELRTQPGVTSEYMGGVLGDIILVNGAPWPVLEVADTKYRFRILNASNARRFELALDPAPRGAPAFVQIGSDGGLLAEPYARRSFRIAPAERFDLVIDFSRYKQGAKVALVNRLGDGRAAQIMRFNVTRHERDQSSIPPRLSRVAFENPKEATRTRVFKFSYSGMPNGWTINGKAFDPGRMDARPKLGTTEIWRLETDFNHPLHLVHFQVLSHSGRPGPYDAGWKDTIDLGPGQAADILVKFSGYRGRYVFHCHNLEHEDMSMMGNFEVV